jgi:hypothetical protein
MTNLLYNVEGTTGLRKTPRQNLLLILAQFFRRVTKNHHEKETCK